MACTGMTFCKLALVPTKEPAVELVRELEAAFPDFDGKIRLNVNGCPNACARYQLSDIGLAGGESAGEGNYQLHLGGDLGEGLAFGHRVRERVLATDTGAVVKGLVAGYLAEREAGESLQSWLRRQPPETLATISKQAGRAGGGWRLMAFGYPVLLELAGRRAVVIGEFAVDAGKVEGLLVAGAEVTVIAKGPEATLARLEDDPRVTVHRRGYARPGRPRRGRPVCRPRRRARPCGPPSPPTPAPPGCWSTSWMTSPTATSPPRRSSAAATWSSPSAPAAAPPPWPAASAPSWASGSARTGPSWSTWSAGSAPPPSPTSPTSRTVPAAGRPPSTWTSWSAWSPPARAAWPPPASATACLEGLAS